MTAKEVQLLKARIKEEIINMQNLLAELSKRNLLKSQHKDVIFMEEDTFLLRAVGSVIHDFYVAVENVFEMISREIDETTPQGLDWHIKLLKQMSLNNDKVRPPVISKETYILLDKFRAFRHVFRNVYGFNLDSRRLKELLADMPATVDAFQEDLSAFMKKMETIIESTEY